MSVFNRAKLSGALRAGLALLLLGFAAISAISCSSKTASTTTEAQQPWETAAPATKSPSLVNQLSLKEALKSGKPTLADFGSDSCAPCRIMKEVLEEVAAEYKGRLNVVIIDVYRNTQLAREYGIMSIPTQILFDCDGKIVSGNVGVLEKEDIVAALERFGVLNE